MSGNDKDLLKTQVEDILLIQGNQFIKELLRENNLPIGNTKKDFLTNVISAIDEDKLTRAMIEEWLKEIEGWGNQHLYLYQKLEISPHEVRQKLEQSEHATLITQGFGYDFPDELSLSNIEITNHGVSLIWQQGKEGWNRVGSKDIGPKKVGLEVFKYEAYRRRLDRSTVRFEWRFTDPYAAVLIHRSKDIDHQDAIQEVWTTLVNLGFCTEVTPLISLSDAVKSASDGGVETKSTRFGTEDGHVEMVSNLVVGGINDIAAVRRARHGLNVDDFSQADGAFIMAKDAFDLSRELSLKIIGNEGHVAIWAQCKRDDIYKVVDHIMALNE